MYLWFKQYVLDQHNYSKEENCRGEVATEWWLLWVFAAEVFAGLFVVYFCVSLDSIVMHYFTFMSSYGGYAPPFSPWIIKTASRCYALRSHYRFLRTLRQAYLFRDLKSYSMWKIMDNITFVHTISFWSKIC